MTFPIDAWLAPQVHMAQVGADVVVLDVRADAYTCLAQGSAHIRIPGQGRLQLSQTPVLADLVAAGWALSEPLSLNRRGVSHPREARAYTLSKPGPDVFSTGVEALISTAQLHRSSLEALVEGVRRNRPAETTFLNPWRTIDRTISAYGTARPWLPRQGLCLQRCFILLQALARRGVPVDWVFGVRTWPFAAHCWLQWEDIVLADDLDRVSAYTPIMVV